MYAQDRRQPTCCSQVGHLSFSVFTVVVLFRLIPLTFKRVREVGCFHMWLFSRSTWIPPFFHPSALFLSCPTAVQPCKSIWARFRPQNLRGNAGSAKRSRRNTVRGPPAGRGATIPRAGLWDPGCEARPRRAYERPPRRCAPWQCATRQNTEHTRSDRPAWCRPAARAQPAPACQWLPAAAHCRSRSGRRPRGVNSNRAWSGPRRTRERLATPPKEPA